MTSTKYSGQSDRTWASGILLRQKVMVVEGHGLGKALG